MSVPRQVLLAGGQLSSKGSFRVTLLSVHLLGGGERAGVEKAPSLLDGPGPEMRAIIGLNSTGENNGT